MREASSGDALFSKYSAKNNDALLARSFDRAEISSKGLRYERLDQLTIEVMLGVR